MLGRWSLMSFGEINQHLNEMKLPDKWKRMKDSERRTHNIINVSKPFTISFMIDVIKMKIEELQFYYDYINGDGYDFCLIKMLN